MPCPDLIAQIQRPERFFPVEVWKAQYPVAPPRAGRPAEGSPETENLSGRPVVIKLVKDESNSATRQWGQRLQDLGTKAKRVNSPAVARTLDVGPDKGVIYVATEFLDPALGWKTLDEEAPRNTTLMVDQSLRIVWNVAQALIAMEKVGAVHGCIIPSKVMVAPVAHDPAFHQVKLRDIGLGHLRLYEDFSATSVQLALYLAPELIDMDRTPDIRSDIYSLGAVFFRMLGGYPPIVGDKVESIFDKKYNTRTVPPVRSVRPDVDKNEAPGLDRVLGKMLAWDPEQRYATGAELSDALEELARSFGIELKPRELAIEKKADETELWRDRELVVARLGARFPKRCILCNQDSGKNRVRRQLHWHAPWLYWLAVFPGLLVYAITAAIIEQTTIVDAGLCKRHQKKQWIALSLMCVLLTGGLAALGGAWYVYSQQPAASTWQYVAATGVILIIAAAAIDFGFRTLMSARNIEDELVWISGAGRKFVETLPQYDGAPSGKTR